MNALKLLSISILVSLYSFFSAQNDIKNTISSGKWYINSIQLGEDIMSIPEDMIKNSWVVFESNSKYKDYTTGSENNTWTYNPKNNTISISNNNKTSIKKIIHIDNNEFIISIQVDSEEMYIFMQKQLL